MNRDDIYKKLRKDFPEKESTFIEKVTADVYYSGEPETILSSSKLVDKLFSRWEKRALEAEVTQKVAAESNSICPICKIPTTPIKLDGNRPAKWCSRHFVVFPVRAED